MIQTKLVDKQGLSGYPSVLGQSDPGSVTQPPEVRFSEVDGGVKFAPTSCGVPDMTSVSIRAVTEDLGTGFVGVKGEAVTLTRDVPHFGKSGSMSMDNVVTAGRYAIWLHIPEDAAKQIQEREHEHVEDFTVAFKLSFQALTDAINGLASQTFSGGALQEAQKNALAALAQAVPYLVPSEPENLSAWTSHVKRVYAALAGLSSLRDGRNPNGGSQVEDYPHKPTWYAHAETPAENDKAGKLLIMPRMKQAETPSAVLITVEAAQIDKSLGTWTQSAPSQRYQESGVERLVPFKVHERVRITRDYLLEGKKIPAGSEGAYDGSRDDTPHPLEFVFEFPNGYESEDFPNGYVSDVFPWDILDYVEVVSSGPAKGESGSSEIFTDKDVEDFDKLAREIDSAVDGK